MRSYVKSQYIRDFNKSLRPAKFASYFTCTYHLLFFGNYTTLKTVFMCCHRIKKPNFNDVCQCVLFKHSNFCSGYWKCILRGQDFNIFPWGHAPRPPVKLTPSALRRCKVFLSPPSPKLLSPTYNLMENPDILLPKSSTGTKLNDANTVYLCE